MITLFLGICAAILPLLPFLIKLFRFGGLVFRLKREKIAHEAVGEPFPLQYDNAIDQHTETVKRTGFKLLLVGTSVVAVGMSFLWYGATAKIEEVTMQLDEKERMRALAVQERDRFYVSYTNAENELKDLRARVSDESIKRQGLIAVDVKRRTVARKGRLDVEKKLPASGIDPFEWMRVESVAGGDVAAPAPTVPDPASVPTGAG